MSCWPSQLLKTIPERDLGRLLQKVMGILRAYFLISSHVTCFGAQITPLAKVCYPNLLQTL
jgi:hypothetical protein